MYIAQDHHSTTFKIIIANDVRFRDINVRRENSYFPGLECWRRRIRIHRQNSKSNTVAAVNPIGLGCDQYQVFHDVSATCDPYWFEHTPHPIIY